MEVVRDPVLKRELAIVYAAGSYLTDHQQRSLCASQHDSCSATVRKPHWRVLTLTVLATLECTGKPYLLKAQLCAFNISDSTTILLTVQNWQITS